MVASFVRPFGAVWRNPGLRRVVGAYVGFNVGEWATWIAILIFAYERGGATESGVVALIQLAPAAVVAPLAAAFADRYRRERVLLTGYVLQAGAMATTAVAMATGAPIQVIYGGAILTASCMSLTRPVHGSILPSLARTPAELTAANVASSTVTNACLLVSPALAGLLYAWSGAHTVFALTAVGCLTAAILVAGVRVDRIGLDETRPTDQSFLREMTGGARALATMRHPRTIVAMLGAAGMIEGATDIFIVVLALDLLEIGEAGAGFLNSAVGAGGLLGAAVAVGLIGRARLARPFILGLAVGGAPLAIAGLLPNTLVAFLVFVALGAGRSVMDVSGRTLLQRVTPDISLARVFGVLEGMHLALLALGSVAVPALLAVAGPTGGLLAAGLWLPAMALIGARALFRADGAAVVHVRELTLLRGLPMFAALPPHTIERLSASLVALRVADGTAVIRQGERGDRFYLIDEGQVEIRINEQLVRTEGPGEGFGEIALLRDVPRTASVVARGEVSLYALGRDVFLSAIAGHPEGRRATEGLVDERLAATPS